MSTTKLIGALALLVFVAGCGHGQRGTAGTTTEESMPPHSLTVAQATDENARYVGLVVSDAFDTSDFRDVNPIGCRINPASLMSEGPPFSVLTTWVKDSPSADFVAAALARLDTLQAEGFQRRPWTRPEPEPPNRRSYFDARGYSVTAGIDSLPTGKVVFEVRAKSPCADS